MKFCGSCGVQLEDNAQFCPSCGAACGNAAQAEATSAQPTAQPTAQPDPTIVQPTVIMPAKPKTNGMAIAGFVLGLISIVSWICCLGTITCILSIIFSAVALSQIAKTGENGKGLAVAGLVISVLCLVGGIALGFVVGTAGALEEFYNLLDI